MPRRLPFLCLSALALLAARSAAQEYVYRDADSKAELNVPMPAAAPHPCDWRSGGCAAAPRSNGREVIAPSPGPYVSIGDGDGSSGSSWDRRYHPGSGGSGGGGGGGGGARFISYDALKKDRVPCGRPGQSYYNCRDHGRANPYHRACTAITRCARYLN